MFYGLEVNDKCSNVEIYLFLNLSFLAQSPLGRWNTTSSEEQCSFVFLDQHC